MNRVFWVVTAAALLLGCSGLAAAQCAGHKNPGGFDLLQTFSGTQDNLTSIGLGIVDFTGSPLPGQVGTADTIVCRITPLPNPIPAGGATLNIQVVALLLKGDTTFHTQPVTLWATINQTNGAIPTSQLPQPDLLPIASTGTMTVFPDGKFDTNLLNIQADLIVVPRGQPVTSTTRLFTTPMPADKISSAGSTWTTTAPAGYPHSTTFPSGGFFVEQPGGGPTAATLIASRVVRGSLYGLGLILVSIAVVKIRSGVRGGQLTLRPVYLLGLAVMVAAVACASSQVTALGPRRAARPAGCAVEIVAGTPTGPVVDLASARVKCLETARGELERAMRKASRKLVARAAADAAGDVYWDGILERGDDRLYVTAAAVNALLEIWTRREGDGRLTLADETPADVKRAISGACSFLERHATSGAYPLKNAFFTSSIKSKWTVAWRYPGNLAMFADGRPIDL